MSRSETNEPDAPAHRHVADTARQLSRRRAPLARAAGALLGMTPFKKKLLGFFLLLAAIGGLLRVPAWIDKAPAVSDAAPALTLPEVRGRGFVDDAPTRSRETTPPAARRIGTAPPPPWTARLGGWMASLGLSFAGGLVLGVFFRSFVKTMAAITAVALAAVAALSYFQIIDLDFTTMRQNVDGLRGQVNDGAGRLKDALSGLLPSGFAAAVGFFFGFRRR